MDSIYSGDFRVEEVEPGNVYYLHDPDYPDDNPWRFRLQGRRWNAYDQEGHLSADNCDDTLDDAIYSVAGLPLWEAEGELVTSAGLKEGPIEACDEVTNASHATAMAGLIAAGIFEPIPQAGPAHQYMLTAAGMDLYVELVELYELDLEDIEALQRAAQQFLDERRAALQPR